MNKWLRGLLPVILLATVGAWHLAAQQTPHRLRLYEVGPSGLPALPQTYLDTSEITVTGATHTVNSGGNLQTAINNAAYGDEIVIQAGAVFDGPYYLPDKVGSGWITVRTSNLAGLPAFGSRVTTGHASAMPRLTAATGSGAAIKTHIDAHHWRFIGIEFAQASGVTNTNTLVHIEAINPSTFEAEQTSLGDVPTDFVFDRIYAHGTTTSTLRRCMTLNSARTAVINSYLSNCHEFGTDSQAIISWNGPGPYKIVNNYLEGAGENVMFGGAAPAITNLVASDIEFKGNYLSKPLTWQIGHGSYGGNEWTIKNVFELKNAQRVLIEGNIFEHSWAHSQNGYCVLFTPRNDTGGATWTVVQDVTFRYNIVRNCGNGISVLAADDIFPTERTKRVWIHDNLLLNIGETFKTGEQGRTFQMIDGGYNPATADVVIEHNTGFPSGANSTIILMGDTHPHERVIFRNNITNRAAFGIFGSGSSEGNASIAQYFPGSVITNNAIIGSDGSGIYPATQFWPADIAAVQFVNSGTGDYHLAGGSPYNNAGTDGLDLGPDIDALNTATAFAEDGTP